MPNTFGELSYNQKTLKPIGRPVDDLKELYVKKGEDYTYVIDNLNATETLLNAIPYEDKDAAIVQAAKTKYKDTLANFTEQGDFENRKLDSKKLANDMANGYGLKQVQENSLTRTAMIKDLKARLNSKQITKEMYDQAVRDSDRKYKGVQKDEVTGEYLGTYTPSPLSDFVSVSKEVANLLENWKANTVVIKDKDGRTLVPTDDGRAGYLEGTTMKYVSKAELEEAAINHIKSDPAIQGQFQQETYYELEDLLNDSNGNRREVNSEDVKKLILKGLSKDLATQLGIKDVKDLMSLDETLKGKDLEEVYRTIKEEQQITSAISLGVSKESFKEYSVTRQKDWLQEFRMNEAASARAAKATTIESSPEGILTTYGTEDHISSADLKSATKAYTENIVNLKANKAKLAQIKGKGNPVEEAELIRAIERGQDVIRNMEDRGNRIISGNAEVSNLLDKAVNGSLFIEGVDDYTTDNQGLPGKRKQKVDGLNINRTAIQRLVWKQIDGTLIEEDLTPFVKLDPKDYLVQAVAEISRGTKTDGLKGMEGNEAFRKEALKRATELQVADSKKVLSKLRTRVKSAANMLVDKADNNEVKYNLQFKKLVLPAMNASDKNIDPIYQLDNHFADITTSANWMNNFSSVLNNKTLIVDLEEEFGVEDAKGGIDWKGAKLQSTIDVRKDPSGQYRPVVLMTVPVRDTEHAGDNDSSPKYKLVDKPIFYSNSAYTKKYIEAITEYKEKLKAKEDQIGLKASERETLDRLHLNTYNLSEYAKTLDNSGLYDGVEGNKMIKWWDGRSQQVTVYNGASPGNFGFLLTSGEGDNLRFWGEDEMGNKALHDRKTIADPTSRITPLGANSVEDLKGLFGNLVDAYALDKPKATSTTPKGTTSPRKATRQELTDAYFMGLPPESGVISTEAAYARNIAKLSQEDQATLGITITKLPNDRIEITKLYE